MEDREAQIKRVTNSPLFPFEGEFTLKELGEPMADELVREGEGGRPCKSCENPDRVLWSNERWKLTPIRPSANPVGLFLETVQHIDFEDFDDEVAAEYGVITRHLEAAIRGVASVGRVHMHRFADGAAHFHVWFQGRPARQLELYGWGNNLWAQVLPPLEADVVDANHAEVITAFAQSFEH